MSLDGTNTSSIQDLYMEHETGKYPLQNASVNIGEDSYCDISPVVGKAFKALGPNTRDYTISDYQRIQPGDSVRVILKWDDKETILFKGMISAPIYDQSLYVEGSGGGLTVGFRIDHPVNALKGLVMGSVLFNDGSTSKRPFMGEDHKDKPLLQMHSPFGTRALNGNRFPEHVVAILTALADWYQDNEDDHPLITADVASLVKAAPVVARDIRTGISSLSQLAQRYTADVIQGGVRGGGSFLDMLKSLSSFFLCTVIPRLGDVIVVPERNSFRPDYPTPVISRDHVLRVGWTKRRQDLPINRVIVDGSMPLMWEAVSLQKEDKEVITIQGGMKHYKGTAYPPYEEGWFRRARRIGPPPILSGAMVAITETSTAPRKKPKDTPTPEQTKEMKTNQSGEIPHNVAPQEGFRVGKAVAQMMYGVIAYAGTDMRIEMTFQGFMFLSEYSGHRWSDDSVYSLLNQVVIVEATDVDDKPTTVRTGDLWADMDELSPYAMVGSVASISINIDTRAPYINVALTLTHVRSKDEDDTHSLALIEHPLYHIDEVDEEVVFTSLDFGIGDLA